MAGKSKFQISRLLDEKVKAIASQANEYEPELSTISEAFIIGFHTSNVSNFVGLTTDLKLQNAAQQILGLVFFKSTPTDEDVDRLLSLVNEKNKEFGSFKTDKNEHLFLIYSYDTESKLVIKRIFDSNEKSFLEEQPKLSVLDVDKLYNHSAIAQVSIPLKLDIFEGASKLADKSKLTECFSSLKKSLTSESKKVKLHLVGSNYSTSSFTGDKNLTETLYDHLEAPKDVDQMGDYLPQLTKEDKKKLVDKWRNKVKAQHAPFEIQLEHKDYGYDESDQSKDCYKLKLDFITLIHMTDPISKSLQSILYSLRQMLSIACHSLCQKQAIDSTLNTDELKLCQFRPSSLGHFVPAAYVIPDLDSAKPVDYDHLRSLRKELHHSYLVPLNQPRFRYSQRVGSGLSGLKNSDEEAGLLCNVHKDILEKSGIKGGARNVIGGTYTYHHYMQDRFNDNGWGCAYRSLQTIISWFKHQGYIYSPDVELRAGGKTEQIRALGRLLAKESRVPTHEEIQRTLVDVGDKQPSFVGSQKWIGSQEVCYVLNHLYNLDSKFISVSSGSELASKARDLGRHFADQSTPVMVGGGVLAHTIIGTDFNEKNGDISYLILDPHYTGPEELASIQKKGWCGWKKNNFWDKNSFYNLCLPQRPLEI